MKYLAIIPAKKKSRRLKNKNTLTFRGIPLIEHTITSAKLSKIFNKIIVSSDNNLLENICKKHGVIFSKRPSNLCLNNVSVVDVCLHEIQKLENNNEYFDIINCLYATAPMRNEKHIRKLNKLLKPQEVNFAVATTTYDLPVQRALKINKDGFLEPIWKKKIHQNDLNFYVNNGSSYAAFIDAFKKEKTFQGKKTKGLFMKKEISIDIDTQYDFDLLNFMCKKNIS